MNKSISGQRPEGEKRSRSNRIFLVDVEAAGPTPITGIMTEFGVVDADTRQWFHGHLWDAHPDPDIPAKPVAEKENPGWTVGFSQFDLKTGHHRSASSAKQVGEELIKWLQSFSQGGRITLLSDNPAFDWCWMACFFDQQGLPNVFGHSARRVGDLAAGILGEPNATSKWKSLRDVKHSHEPHEDSQGNAGAWRKLHELNRRMNELYPSYRDDARRIFNDLRRS